MAWTSSSSKNKPSPAERAALTRLDSVRRQRAPFAGLSRQLVAETLEQYLPPDGPVIEIGMGDGQLYERLPPALLPRMRHTEPMAAAMRSFRKQHPAVTITQAPAERLPFEAGSAAAVVGLCVMDVVPDIAAVARELGRVLRPGGRFIHWLDMSTVLLPVVASLDGTGLVPLPNVFADPSASPWPEDLFLMPLQQLALIIGILQAHGHGLARPLAQYVALFATSPLAVGPAAAELVQLQDTAALRAALRSGFQSALELATPDERAALAAFQGRPVSSARHFEQRLRSSFSADTGFAVELSDLHRAWELGPRSEGGFAYSSCCVGEQRHLSFAPDSLLSADAALPDEGSRLAELGVFVFVATRI